jgi:hypothetical protein
MALVQDESVEVEVEQMRAVGIQQLLHVTAGEAREIRALLQLFVVLPRQELHGDEDQIGRQHVAPRHLIVVQLCRDLDDAEVAIFDELLGFPGPLRDQVRRTHH